MSVRERRAKGKGLKRKKEVRTEKVVFKVYTEGIATEVEYVDMLKQLPEVAASADVGLAVVDSGGVPKTLVDRAVDDKNREDIEADRYWCIFDVECPQPHPHLNDAWQKARDNGVRLAVSNPCFEYWLVLHHAHRGGAMTTDEAIALRCDHDGSDGKHLDAAVYLPRVGQAGKNAKRVRRGHEQTDTRFPHDNPSTRMDLLVDDLLSEVRRATGADES